MNNNYAVKYFRLQSCSAYKYHLSPYVLYRVCQKSRCSLLRKVVTVLTFRDKTVRNMARNKIYIKIRKLLVSPLFVFLNKFNKNANMRVVEEM